MSIPAEAYSIPVPHQDLQATEALVAILSSLENLESVATDVFDRINTKITDSKQRLVKINERIALAQIRIAKVKGSNKAACLRSCSQYPPPTIIQSYVSVFSDLNGKYHHPTDPPPVPRVPLVGPSHESIQQQPGLLSRGPSFLPPAQSISRETMQCSSQLPSHLSCVTNLLLYNTNDQIYKGCLLRDTESRKVSKPNHQKPVPSNNKDASLPQITNRIQSAGPSLSEFSYQPIMDAVPSLQVPDTLPNLPGIVDFHWSASTEIDQPSIAIMHDSITPSTSSASSRPISTSPIPPPPPPPLLPQSHPPSHSSVTQSPPPSHSTVTQSPPAIPNPSVHLSPIQSVMPLPLPAALHAGRSNLLDAIRNAGGVGKVSLKSAAQRTCKETPNEANDRPLNLIGALQNHLRRRQAALAGRDGDQEGSTRVDSDESLEWD